MPKSIEAFYQESGRAGRDGHNSECVLFYAPKDFARVFNMTRTAPKASRKREQESIRAVKAYCEGSGLHAGQCRRVGLLAHFNETATAATCKGMCDVCRPRENEENAAACEEALFGGDEDDEIEIDDDDDDVDEVEEVDSEGAPATSRPHAAQQRPERAPPAVPTSAVPRPAAPTPANDEWRKKKRKRNDAPAPAAAPAAPSAVAAGSAAGASGAQAKPPKKKQKAVETTRPLNPWGKPLPPQPQPPSVPQPARPTPGPPGNAPPPRPKANQPKGAPGRGRRDVIDLLDSDSD